MSVAVPLNELPDQVLRFGFNPYIVTVSGDSTPRVTSVRVSWDGTRLVPHQSLAAASGRAFATFDDGGQTYLAVASIAAPTRLLRLTGTQFTEAQVLDGLGARELAAAVRAWWNGCWDRRERVPRWATWRLWRLSLRSVGVSGLSCRVVQVPLGTRGLAAAVQARWSACRDRRERVPRWATWRLWRLSLRAVGAACLPTHRAPPSASSRWARASPLR